MSTNNIESSVTGQPMDKAEGWGYGTNDPQPKQHPKEVDALVLDVYLGGTTEAHLLPPKVEEKIRELSIPGVRWGQKWDVEEVAFGVKKIRIQALIDNMSQETQTVQDAVSRVYGVKSVEFVAFTKA